MAIRVEFFDPVCHPAGQRLCQRRRQAALRLRRGVCSADSLRYCDVCMYVSGFILNAL